MLRNRFSLALAAFAASLFAWSGTTAAQEAPKGDAAKGKAAFVKHGCWQCHGFEGQGSTASSGGKVLSHTDLPVEGLIAFVRGTNRAMPPYSEQILSDADLTDIYAYLQSVPKPPDAKSIKLLNP
jgi:ubiquinol-cytochrome c reductase cytochrome c subunit